MTLQKKLKQFGETLAGLSVSVFHCKRPKHLTNRYVVWQEEGEGESFYAGNRKTEFRIAGTMDYYTKVEFDPAVDEIQQLLEGVAGCTWRLESVQYEETTERHHYEWSWELGYGDA